MLDDAEKQFPEIEARGLDGRTYRVPEELEGERNIPLVAFHRHQQQPIDGWLPPLLELIAEHGRAEWARLFEQAV